MSVQARAQSIFQWISRHPRWSTAIAVIVVAVVIFGQNDKDDGASATAAGLVTQTSGAQASRSPTMPNLVGMGLREAESSAPRGYSVHDLSPLSRGVWITSNWTVAATVPTAGSPLPSAEGARLYYLRNDEYTWFRQHPEMPDLPIGTSRENIPQLAGIRELIDYRYATESAPTTTSPPHPIGASDSQPASEPPEASSDPSVELASERASREALASAAYDSAATVVDSLPRAGEKIRIGRMITVVLKPQPQPTYVEPTETAAGTYSGGSSDTNSDESHRFVGHVPSFHCRKKWC